MTLHLTWYNAEQTAFRVRYESGWTWEQHHALVQQLKDMRLARGLTRSICLFDLRGTTVPFNSSASQNYTDPRENSYIVIVLDNIFTRTIAQLAIRARGHQHMIRLAETVEEGEALVDAHILQMQSFTGTQPNQRP